MLIFFFSFEHFQTGKNQLSLMNESMQSCHTNQIEQDNQNGKSGEERVAVLIGITSWSAACGYAEWPDVYGRVNNREILDWIEKITDGEK